MSENLSRRSFLRRAVVATAGLGAILAGCQPKVVEVEKVVKETVIVEAESENLMAKADESAMVSAAGSGATVLEYWNGLTGEDGITMLKIIQQWTQENPEVAVKTQRIPWGNYFDKLLPAIVAGSGPDVFILHGPGELMEWQPKGVLLPLDDIFETGMLPRDDYRDNIIEPMYADGHIWGMPLDAYGPVLYLNLDLLEEAGIEYDPEREPMTRDEFLQVVNQLTWDTSGRHPDETGFDLGNVDVWGYAGRDMVSETYRQNGVDSVSMDGTCQAMVTDPLFLDGVQWGRDLTWQYYVKPGSDFDANQAFAANKLAIRSNGSWYYNWFKDYPEGNWGVWYWPQIGAERGVWVGTHCHCLPTTLEGDKLDWGKQMIAAIGQSHLWSSEAGMPSARTSISEHPQVASNWALPMQFRQHEWIYPSNLSYPCRTEVSGILNPYIASALNNEMEPLAAMQEAEAQIQPILDRCCS